MSNRSLVAILMVAALAIILNIGTSEAAPSGSSMDQLRDSNEIEQSGSPRSALTRFLFYNARPTERQAVQSGTLGYKRSSSALDALTGVTLGKRALPSMELVNLEPLFDRQYKMQSMPRMYDLRWGPLDSYNGPTGYHTN